MAAADHCEVRLHIVVVQGENLLSATALLVLGTGLVDLRAAALAACAPGAVLQGCFAARDVLEQDALSLDLAFLCTVPLPVDGSEAASLPKSALQGTDWLLQAWSGGDCASRCANVVIWPDARGEQHDVGDACVVGPQPSFTPDLVSFLAVLRQAEGGKEILLVEEPERKHSKRGGKWFLPAGHVDTGETFVLGAKREAMEEAHVDVEVDGLLAVVYRRCHKNMLGPHLLLSAHASSSAPLDSDGRPTVKAVPDHESLSARWFPLDQVLATAGGTDEEADSFFRVYKEMRVHFGVIRDSEGAAPIFSK